jgi:ribosomal protein RSM22 (predicted rRNA methylase)
VHQDQAWREISQRLNLDLRVLPYSFLVLENGGRLEPEAGCSRVIGTPREFKGHLKVLACDSSGVQDWVLQKRDAPELFKELRKGESLPLHRWRVEEGKIVGKL